MNSKIEQLKQEIHRLKEEIADREAAFPAHSARPRQLIAIEELEEELQRKQVELQKIRRHS